MDQAEWIKGFAWFPTRTAKQVVWLRPIYWCDLKYREPYIVRSHLWILLRLFFQRSIRTWHHDIFDPNSVLPKGTYSSMGLTVGSKIILTRVRRVYHSQSDHLLHKLRG